MRRTSYMNPTPLTAKYKGGAAGRYVTRELSVTDGLVAASSGSHGRFTAKAELTAMFGQHTDTEADDRNTLRGTIKGFVDGDEKLDMEVTLLPAKDIGADGSVPVSLMKVRGNVW